MIRRIGMAIAATAVVAWGLGQGAAWAVPPEALQENGEPARAERRPAPQRPTAGVMPTLGGAPSVRLVKDINPGPNGSSIAGWTEYRGERYFTANDGSASRLFKVDRHGRVSQIPGIFSNAQQLAVFRDELYFAGQRGDEDIELYKLGKDGVVRLVADINQNGSGLESSSYPSYFTVFADALYFGAGGSDGGLYRVNSGGAVEYVDPIFPEYWGTIFVENQDELYFAGQSSLGFKLFKVTKQGTVALVADIDAYELTSFKGELYFNAFRPDVGHELFKVNRAGQVELVADINPGPPATYPAGSSEPGYWGGFVPYNGELYFKADAGDPVGPELHKIGRDGKVTLVADITPTAEPDPNRARYNDGPDLFLPFNGELYFTIYGGVSVGRELYKVKRDGSVALVADIDSSDEYGSDPQNFTPYRGQLYFSAYRLDVGGYELFRLSRNGTVELVDDINPTPGSAILPRPLTYGVPSKTFTPQFGVFLGQLYLKAVADPNVGTELYTYGRVR